MGLLTRVTKKKERNKKFRNCIEAETRMGIYNEHRKI